jgi:LCP family protein required for cell wall assembly
MTSPTRETSPIRLPLWALAIFAVLLLIGIIASAVWLFRTVQDVASASTSKTAEFTIVEEVVAGEQLPSNDASPDNAEQPLPVVAPDELEPWPGNERINFLFLGVDQRCDEEGPTHTDSIMVVTVDPLSMSSALLSLPRDLWVEIPGFGVDRINQAYYFGQAYEYPGGGQSLALETVEALLGIPIDYYVTVDFAGFIEAVDLIGGIVVDIPEAIVDPDYPDNCYGYDPFSLQAGKQRLDGEVALKFARTRATFGGDVDRAERQQEVLLAVRNQVLRVEQFPKLLVQAPQLWQTFQDNVGTNLSLEDALELALLVQDIPEGNIQTAILDYDYVYNETTPDGRQVLVPLRNEIRLLRDELFTPQAAPTPIIENLPQLMVQEGGQVAIHNGTAVFGLAADTEAYLQKLDVDIAEIGNADSSAYNTSQIIDYGSHPYTVQFLIQEMQIPPLNLSSGSKAAGEYDVLVIVGNDWANQLTDEQ